MKSLCVIVRINVVVALALTLAVGFAACGSSSTMRGASSNAGAVSDGSSPAPGSGSTTSVSSTQGKLTPPHVVIDCLAHNGFAYLAKSTTVQESVPDTAVVEELSGPSTVRTRWNQVYDVAEGPDAQDAEFFSAPASLGGIGEAYVVIDGTEKMAESRVEEARKDEAVQTHGAPNPGVLIGERDNVTWAVFGGGTPVERAIAGCVPYAHSGALKRTSPSLPSASSTSTSSSSAGAKLDITDPCRYFPKSTADEIAGRDDMVPQGNETMNAKPALVVQCEYEAPHSPTETYALVALIFTEGVGFTQAEELQQRGMREEQEKGEEVTERLIPTNSLGVPAYFVVSDEQTEVSAETRLSFLSDGTQVVIETGSIPPSARLDSLLEAAAKRVIAGA